MFRMYHQTQALWLCFGTALRLCLAVSSTQPLGLYYGVATVSDTEVSDTVTGVVFCFTLLKNNIPPLFHRF